MRIISGNLKGRNIDFIKSEITRPLKDSVRESIFNIISHSNLLDINLINANVLDLYSGVGSFGLECLSRGSNKITFVEKDNKALDILNKNLFNLSLQEKARVVNNEIINFLSTELNEKYEIIFLDPPFLDSEYIKILEMIYKKNIYKKKHLVVIHRENKSSDDFIKIINPVVVKKYGRSKVIFGNFLS